MRKAIPIALAAASGIVLAFPGRAAAVDLGTIAIETSVNGEIFNSAFPSDSESCPGTTLDLTATSQSSHLYPGFNSVGAIIDVDPIDTALTYSTILGGTGVGLSNGFPSSSTSVAPLPRGRSATQNTKATLWTRHGQRRQRSVAPAPRQFQSRASSGWA